MMKYQVIIEKAVEVDLPKCPCDYGTPEYRRWRVQLDEAVAAKEGNVEIQDWWPMP